MKKLNLTIRLCLIALATAAAAPSFAMSNAQFDAQFNSWLGGLQQQNQASQMALRQQHLQQNRPRLIAGWQQAVASGQRISFEQYAYWDLMSAAGTNVQGALDAQRRQYEGNRAAHATVMAGNASYNAGMYANSARTSAAVGNWTTGAIRGQAAYSNGNGGSQLLPYYSPAGQVINNGGNYYVQDQQGTYFQYTGNGWTRLNAR